MATFSTLLFDLDGTLIDHFHAIHRAHSHTRHALGLPPPTMAEVRAAVGGGLENALVQLVGPDRVAAALKIYQPYWDATMLDDVSLFPGARELLATQHARGTKLAVLTNKHGPSARRICDRLDITRWLDGVFGAGDTPFLKPRPEFTRHALAALGAAPERTLFVGDSPYDLQTAREAALACWCVTTGTHDAAQLCAAGAESVFPDLIALARELDRSSQRP